MPYTEDQWQDGAKGSTFEATAAKFQHMEIAIKLATIMINLKEAPFNTSGGGVTDDSTAINSALTLAAAGGEEWVLWVPLGTYLCFSTLKVGANVRIVGANQHNCRFIAKGNIDLFQFTEGNNTVESVYVEAQTAQASGSAFDLSHGFAADIHFAQIKLGHNFFNGFYCVGATEIGALYFREIHFLAWNGAVKGYGHAGFVFGSSANRVAVVSLANIHGQANLNTDMPKWFEINNTDSMHGNDVKLQNGTEGICIGNSDTSALKTTGFKMVNVFVDTMSGLGYKIEKCKDLTLTSANAQNCGEGAFHGPEAIDVKWVAPQIQSNKTHGMRFGPTCQQGVTVTGGTISDNNSAGAAEASHISGVFIEGGAKNITFTGGCKIGNLLFYGEKQSYGIYMTVGKTENVYVDKSCRVPEKAAGIGENKVKAIENASGAEGKNNTLEPRLI